MGRYGSLNADAVICVCKIGTMREVVGQHGLFGTRWPRARVVWERRRPTSFPCGSTVYTAHLVLTGVCALVAAGVAHGPLETTAPLRTAHGRRDRVRSGKHDAPHRSRLAHIRTDRVRSGNSAGRTPTSAPDPRFTSARLPRAAGTKLQVAGIRPPRSKHT